MPEQQSTLIETFFPVGGLVQNVNHRQQPPSTYADGLNVMPFDAIEDRARGGQRLGTSRYVSGALNGTNFIQNINRTVRFVDPGTVQIVAENFADNFNFLDGFVSARDNVIWLEDRARTAVGGGATPTHPTSISLWGDIAMPTNGQDARWIVEDERGHCDWVSDALENASPNAPWPNGDAGAVADNEIRILRQVGDGTIAAVVYPPDVANPPGSFTKAIIRMTVITSSTGETAGDYMTGIIFRYNTSSETYFMVGWRKPDTVSTQQIALIDETGADVDATTTVTPAGTTDSLPHILELRLNGDDIEVLWDGVSQFTYDISGDAHDTISDRNVGIYHHRLRGSGTWTNAVIGGVDNWQFFEAEESPGLREEKLIVTTGGDIMVGDRVSGLVNAIGGDNQLVSDTRLIDSVFAFQSVYFLDGLSYHQYTLSSNTVGSWSADGTATLPGGDAGPDAPNVSRGTIITLWQGRLTISGLASDQSNVFFSAVGLPNDWDATGTDAGSAVDLGSNFVLGQVGDIVTALIPDRGQRLIIGGANTISVLLGNPAIVDVSSPSFPRILVVSNAVGMAGGSRAWAFAPDGTIFFWGPDGLYTLPPLIEQQATSLSAANKVSGGRLDKTFRNIDLSQNQIQMLWDTDSDGLWIFVTPMDTAVSGTHYFFDRRTGGFHPQKVPADQGPTAIFNFRSDRPADTAFFLGGADSFLRKWDRNSKDDDATAIDSNVLVGPLISPFPGREMRITKIVTTLAEGSDELAYDVLVGDTVEGAKTSTAAFSGTWTAGLNAPVMNRARGGAAYIKLRNATADRRWAIESIQATLTAAGPVRVR